MNVYPNKTVSIVSSLICLLLASFGIAQSHGGYTSGAAAFCDSINSGFISLNSYTGNIIKWESSSNGGVSWIDIANLTSTQSYNNLKKSTGFRAIVKNGNDPADTSTICWIKVQVKGETGTITGGGIFCEQSGSGKVELLGYDGNILHWEYSLDNGNSWTNLSITAPQVNYSNISQNTIYRAIVQTQSVCPYDTTHLAVFKIDSRSIAGTVSGADSLCFNSHGDTLNLSGNTGLIVDWISSSDNGLTWKSMSNTSSFLVYERVTKSTWYKVLVKNGVCSTQTTQPAVVGVFPINRANAGDDVTIIQYQPFSLNGSGNGSANWEPAFSLSNAGIFNPQASPVNTTTYVLTLTDKHSCVTSDSVIVEVIIPIPTAITPNDDNVNDFFEIDKIETYPENNLTIFNRWGNIVYQKSPYLNDWNGKSSNGHNLPDDIYYYIFDYGNGDKKVTNYILIKR